MVTVHRPRRHVLGRWLLVLASFVSTTCLASDHRQPTNPEVAIDAHDAKNAAAEAKAAANHAKEVATHSVRVAHSAHRALKRARDALKAVKTVTTTPAPLPLKVSSVENNVATLAAQPPAANESQLGQMQEELEQLRQQLAACRAASQGGQDKSIEQMDQELGELQEMLRRFEDEEAKTGKTGSHGTIRKEIDNLKGVVARLEKLGTATVSFPKAPEQAEGELRYRMPPAKVSIPKVQLTPLSDLDIRSSSTLNSPATIYQPPPAAPLAGVPPPAAPVAGANSIDIDTQMPYGELEPFGREDTAQELTEASIAESDAMVDQLERAEVAEEKRAVFRALTRLRGAAITSFDGIANSQTGNIDEYNQVHQWRITHPLNHLADEESDVSKWAFPDNAD